MEYAWKEGVRFKADPNETGRVLSNLRNIHGELTAEIVLEEAKKEESVLHNDFQWDDKKAANLYRIDTARRVIRHLRVVSDGERTDEPVYVHVTQGKRRYYEQTNLAVESPDIWLNVMVEEKARLEACRKRVQSLVNIEKNSSRVSITQSVISNLDSTIKQINV
tara:strand:- start:1275 stop:1766 length:492 start_codon:yes stop_codon:yes gene_type:complete